MMAGKYVVDIQAHFFLKSILILNLTVFSVELHPSDELATFFLILSNS